MSGNNSNGSVSWGSPGLQFQLSSCDAGLLDAASTVFSPWLRPAASSNVCRWRVERYSADTSANLESFCGAEPIPGMSVVVSSDNCLGTTVHANADKALLHIEYNSVQKLFELSRPLGLHAALLSQNGCGVMIVGRSESGKSTLACALWQRGWCFHCDDYVLVTPESCSGRPAPRRVSLRKTSRNLLGEQLWSQILATQSCGRTQKGFVFHPSDIDGKPQVQSTSLSAVIFLERFGQDMAPAELAQVEPAYALLSLIPYTNLCKPVDRGEAIRCLQPLANSLPAFDLGRGQLSRMVERIEQLVAEKEDAGKEHVTK